jgi:outer membrane protein OmpA-like peptidoglycan-associated protein
MPVAVPAPVPVPAPVEAPRVAVAPTPAPPPAATAVAPAIAARPVPQTAVAPKSYTFEDVYFDLDGYTPRPEAMAGLDEAAKAMIADPTLNLTVEGHTCNIGTAEYNVALGDRRATAVRDYFVNRGIAANRLRTASYGEDDPEHANAHEDTRRFNRRVALVVRLQP